MMMRVATGILQRLPSGGGSSGHRNQDVVTQTILKMDINLYHNDMKTMFEKNNGQSFSDEQTVTQLDKVSYGKLNN